MRLQPGARSGECGSGGWCTDFARMYAGTYNLVCVTHRGAPVGAQK